MVGCGAGCEVAGAVGDYDKGYMGESHDVNNQRVTSGYLPAFFSFNVKSPTVDGMTGSARISFAPVIASR